MVPITVVNVGRNDHMVMVVMLVVLVIIVPLVLYHRHRRRVAVSIPPIGTIAVCVTWDCVIRVCTFVPNVIQYIVIHVVIKLDRVL